MKRDRQLADLETAPRRPDHHLRGELHPGRLESEHRKDVATHRPHPAVSVADRRPEEKVEEAREQRVADPAQPRHGARLDSLQPVSHHEIGAAVELADEARDLLEVVREVGVDHHDVVAPGRGEAGQVGAPVAAPGLVDDPGAGEAGEHPAAVFGAVVDDDDLAVESVLVEDALRRVHTLADALGLVQARDDDRHADCIAGRRRTPLPEDANRHTRHLTSGRAAYTPRPA